MNERMVVEMPECLQNHCAFLAKGLTALSVEEAEIAGGEPQFWSASDVVTFLVDQYFHPCEGCLEMAENAFAIASEEEDQSVPSQA